MSDQSEPVFTKTGKELTDADFEALADEAERGYDLTGVVGVQIDRGGMGIVYRIVRDGVILDAWPSHIEPFPEHWPEDWKQLVNRALRSRND